MIILEKRNHLVLRLDNKTQFTALRGHFSVPHPQASLLKKRKSYLKDWDGKVSFVKLGKQDPSGLTAFLPVGFLPKLLSYLDSEDLPYIFENKVPLSPIPFGQHLTGDDGQPLILDPTQMEAAKALLASRRAVIELGTGSGKTELVINDFMCVREVYPDVKLLFVVPSRNLLTQTVERVRRRLPWLDKVGIIGEGKFEVDSPIVIGTNTTTSAAEHILKSEEIKAYLKTVDILAIDEAHHSRSFQGQKLIDLCPAIWLWAVSAKVTFFDKKHIVTHWTLEGLFGEPAFRGKSAVRTCPTTVMAYTHKSWTDELADLDLYGTYAMGLPVRFKFNPEETEWQHGTWRGPDVEGKLEYEGNEDLFKEVRRKGRMVHVRDKTKFGIYVQQDDGWEKVQPPRDLTVYWNTHDIGIVHFKPRNRWVRDLAVRQAAAGEPFVVSVRRTAHIRKILNSLTRAGLRVEAVSGQLSGAKQLKLFQKVIDRELDGIVAIYSIVAEGVDIPNLIHLIKADGITNEQVLTQQRGRVERVFPGKPMGYIHVPRDVQEPRLMRSSQQITGYYRRLNVKVVYIHEP